MQFPRLNRGNKARPPSNPQAQSPLLATLPTELRLKIFTLALYSSPIPLAVEGPKGARVLTLQSPGIGGPEVAAVRTARLLSLLLTCTRAYAEGLPLLYGINTFSTGAPGVLHLLADRAGATLIKRLDFSWSMTKAPIRVQKPKGLRFMIQNNPRELQEWDRFGKTLRKFEALQWLQLELSVPMHWTEEWREHESEILSPLKDVLKEEAYGELWLSWPRYEQQDKVAAENLLKDWVIKRRFGP